MWGTPSSPTTTNARGSTTIAPPAPPASAPASFSSFPRLAVPPTSPMAVPNAILILLKGRTLAWPASRTLPTTPSALDTRPSSLNSSLIKSLRSMPETNQSRAAPLVKAKFGRAIARDEALALRSSVMRQLKLGTLTAHVTGGTDREGGGTGPVVVLMHGYGAPGTDLVSLWRELAVPHEVRFVFPEAPLETDFGGRAWWPIDMIRLQTERFSEGGAERLMAEVPPGIDAARAAVLELLAVLERDFGAVPEQTLIGGFSQGAMLATDVVLRSSRAFGGLALLSG